MSRRIMAIMGCGLLATAALSLTGFTALGGFSATVENNAGSTGSGTLLLQEGVGSTICISTGTGTTSSTAITGNDNATCPIDLFNDSNLDPGATESTTVTLTNPGTLTGSSLALDPGTCTQSDNSSPGGTSNTYYGTDTDFCGELDVTIEDDGTSTCVFPASGSPCGAPSSSGTLDSLAGADQTGLPGLGAGDSTTYTVTIGLDSGATNADQGLLATVPLTWVLSQ